MIPEVANSVLGDKDEEKAPPLAWINLACIAAVANLGNLSCLFRLFTTLLFQLPDVPIYV
jgi:hypothetical protein